MAHKQHLHTTWVVALMCIFLCVMLLHTIFCYTTLRVLQNVHSLCWQVARYKDMESQGCNNRNMCYY